jgi:hypothetical protein
MVLPSFFKAWNIYSTLFENAKVWPQKWISQHGNEIGKFQQAIFAKEIDVGTSNVLYRSDLAPCDCHLKISLRNSLKDL